LEILQRKVYEIRKHLAGNDLPVTSINIKQLLLNKEINQEKRMLMEIFQYHNEQIALLIGKDHLPASLLPVALSMVDKYKVAT